MNKLLLTTLLLFIYITTSFAQEHQEQEVEKKYKPVRLLIGGALEFGGDKVAETHFVNGDVQSTPAGQGGSVAVGGQFELPNLERLLLRATIGYKYVTTKADNAHIRLTRIPLHLTANFMATDKIRLGAGLVSHRNISYKTDGMGEDFKLKGNTDAIFEVAYSFLGISYTAMTYKDQQNTSYSANSIGVTISGVIPKR